MNPIASLFRFLTWLSYFISVISFIVAIWSPNTAFFLKTGLTGLIGIVAFYILEQKSY